MSASVTEGTCEATFDGSRECFEELLGWLGGDDADRLDHGELEEQLDSRGRELLRRMYQDRLDLRAAKETRLDAVVDAEEIRHGAVEAGHSRSLSTIFGTVTVSRLAYRHRGHANLYPCDGQLNLPQERYSHGLRRLAVTEAARGSFEEAIEAIGRACGQKIGKRQAETLTADAAVDVEGFYASRQHEPAAEGDVLVISADGKGIVMRPESLRPATAAKAQEATQRLECRLSKGEKRNRKRLAEVGAVYDVTPVARTAADIMSRDDQAQPVAGPEAKNKWVTASVAEDAKVVLAGAFDEAERRDPEHERTWVALVDGNNHQIERIEAEGAARGITTTVVIDFVHVLEFLWAAAWCLYPEGDPAAEAWVRSDDRHPRRQRPGGRRRPAQTGQHRKTLSSQTQKGGRGRQIPHQQGRLPRLPHSARLGLADRHRGDRRSMPSRRQGPHGHHRGPMERPGSRSSSQTASCPSQRRLPVLLALSPPTTTTTRARLPLCQRRHSRRCIVTPGEPHPNDLAAELAALRPRPGDQVGYATRIALRELGRRAEFLAAQIDYLDRLLLPLVELQAPSLLEMYGAGPHLAAILIIAAGDHPDRLRCESAWAHLCGAAPIPAGSGKTSGRFRLNPGGDRQANHALWRIVFTRLGSHQPTQVYVERRLKEGKTKTEIIRCLKRYVAREVYHHLLWTPA